MSSLAMKPESTDIPPAEPKDEPDPFAVVAAALAQAQRTVSSARAAPKPPTILASVAEAQLDALRAEIAALKESAERDRTQMDALRKDLQDTSAALDLARAEIKTKAAEMQMRQMEHVARLLAMQKKTETESQAEREAARKEREFIITERTAVDAEKQKLLEDRKLIAQQLHRMIQFIQPTSGTSPHNTAAAVSIGETHPNTPADLTIPSRRRATQDSTTSDESTSRKRPRTEGVTNPPTISASPPLNTSQAATREPAPTPSTPMRSPPTPIQSPTRSFYAPLSRTDYPLITLSQRARGLPSRGTPRPGAAASSPSGAHPSHAPPMSPTRDPRRPCPS